MAGILSSAIYKKVGAAFSLAVNPGVERACRISGSAFKTGARAETARQVVLKLHGGPGTIIMAVQD
jgi:hypothetical protein